MKTMICLVALVLAAGCESADASKVGAPVVVVSEQAKSCGNCNDNNPCTTDTCESNVCTHKEVADCVLCKKVMDPAIERQCYDGNACTDDTCVDGVCKFTAVSSCWACNEDSDCDDGNACTYDECHFDNLGGGCAHWVSPLPTKGESWKKCDDSDPCTGGDVCHGSQCFGTVMSCDDGLPNTLDTCDAQKGCLHVPTQKFCPDPDESCGDGSCRSKYGNLILCDKCDSDADCQGWLPRFTCSGDQSLKQETHKCDQSKGFCEWIVTGVKACSLGCDGPEGFCKK